MKKALFALAILFGHTAQAQTSDSTVTVLSGVATTIYRPATQAQAAYIDTVRYPSFVRLVSKQVVGKASPAVLLLVTPEQGDYYSYVNVKYRLVSASWEQLYEGTLTISGTSYQYYQSLSGIDQIGYAYWKVLESPTVGVDIDE